MEDKTEFQYEQCWNQMYCDSTLMSWLHIGSVPQEEKSSLSAPPISARGEWMHVSPSDLNALPTEMQVSKCNCIYLSCSTLCFIQHSKKWTKKGSITKYMVSHTWLNYSTEVPSTNWVPLRGKGLKESYKLFPRNKWHHNKYVMGSGGQPGKLKGSSSEYNQWLWVGHGCE